VEITEKMSDSFALEGTRMEAFHALLDKLGIVFNKIGINKYTTDGSALDSDGRVFVMNV
jgi:hypothetical protein